MQDFLARAIQWVLPSTLREKLNNIAWMVWLYQKIISPQPAVAVNEPEKRYSYLDFVALHEQKIADLPVPSAGPVISIIVPVYQPDISMFKACVASVQQQKYKNWQLILVDDASNHKELSALLEELSNIDNIIVKVRRENGHISAATNSGLARATGNFLALLDQDDLLHPMALACVAQHINTHPNTMLVYTDEDKLSEKEERYEPHFKPDFSPDLFYSTNYISHLGVYETNLAREIGGCRVGLEGSQDYDFALRFISNIKSSQIAHLPYVLYHWRALPGSTAYAADEKSYTVAAGLKALKDHFKDDDSVAGILPLPVPNTYKVNWKISPSLPEVEIIIPTRNGIDILKPCLSSIEQTVRYANLKITIIDNQSDCPETLAFLKTLKDKNIRIRKYDKPFNYAQMHNEAVSASTSDYILLLNNDIEAQEQGWFEEMLAVACRSEVGVVGATLLYPDNTIQHAGVTLGVGGVANHAYLNLDRNTMGYFGRAKLRRNVSAVTGACMMFKRHLWDAVNGMDAQNLSVAFNDVDFCMKVSEAGFYNVVTPFACLYHHESKTRGEDVTPEKRARFVAEVNFMLDKWADKLSEDRFYSVNLSKKSTGYELLTLDEWTSSFND